MGLHGLPNGQSVWLAGQLRLWRRAPQTNLMALSRAVMALYHNSGKPAQRALIEPILDRAVLIFGIYG